MHEAESGLAYDMGTLFSRHMKTVSTAVLFSTWQFSLVE